MSETATNDENAAPGNSQPVIAPLYVGLGGWLILVGLGVVITPLRIAFLMMPTYVSLITNGTWAALTTPGSESYKPQWAPLLGGEMFINISLIIAWLMMAYFFFSKKRIFPKLYIGIMSFTLVYIIVDAIAVKSVLPDQPILNPTTLKEVSRQVIAMLIWIPYMLVSKRVQATFVN